MKTLISIAVTISDHQIKIKSVIFIEAFNKIFNKNHVIFNNFLNEITVD